MANKFLSPAQFTDKRKCISAIISAKNLRFDSADISAVKKSRDVLEKLRGELKKYDDSDWRRGEIARRTNAITQAAVENPDSIAGSKPVHPAEDLEAEISHHCQLEADIRRDLAAKLQPVGLRMFSSLLEAAREMVKNQHAYELQISEKFGVQHMHSNLLGCFEQVAEDAEKTLKWLESGKGIDPGSFSGMV